jgi:hypothetical protein
VSLIDNYANASVIATMQSSAFNLNVGAPKPPNTFDGINAMVEIHPDTPLPVRSRFGAARRLYFQFIEDGIPDSGNPRYNSIDVAGRSESYMAYAGGENRKVSLTLGFVSSVNQGDEGEAGVAVRCAEWLRAFAQNAIRVPFSNPSRVLPSSSQDKSTSYSSSAVTLTVKFFVLNVRMVPSVYTASPILRPKFALQSLLLTLPASRSKAA